MDVRSEIDALVAEGNALAARRRLDELWMHEAGPSTAAFVVSRHERLRGHAAYIPCRVAILRSFTVEPVVPLLRAEAFRYGLDLTVHVGDFNAYAQEILDGHSALYRFAPDVVLLAILGEELAPELFTEYADAAAGAIVDAGTRVAGTIDDLIRFFRSHSQAHFVVPTFERPAMRSFGVLDDQSSERQDAAIAQLNDRLHRIARSHLGVYVMDYDGLVARHGRLRWRDERKWRSVGLPIAGEHLVDLAREWIRFIVPLSGRAAKALAVDLDNTLWGGTVGEDGIEGIQVGPDLRGAGFRSLQRAMLDLSRRGVLLAVCSKNNPAEAMEALERHPGMLLRPKDFAALRINWVDKADNLRAIASELNIGIDALAFVDDNPAECDRVREALPEVAVLHLSGDPLTYAAQLRDCPLFERLSRSVEDARRGDLYAAQNERAQAAQRFASKEDFYRFLDQEVDVAKVTAETIPRAAQLTQKTNQFNLTTRRYSEQDIAAMASDPECDVLIARVRDRYGDQGLVGVAITRPMAASCEIDTFLLSCRVIGRTVESALLAAIALSARERGRTNLTGWLIPTKKNEPARQFYAQHGFTLCAQDGPRTKWALTLADHPVACPDWIRLHVETDRDIDSVAAGSTHSR